MQEQRKNIKMQGTGVSPGVAIEKVYIVERTRVRIPRYNILPPYIDDEIRRFRKAIESSKEQLEKVRERILYHPDIKEQAYIIDSYIMILQDGAILDETEKRINTERINAEWAFQESLNKFREIFERIDDEYLRGRWMDIEHIKDRVLRNLMGSIEESIADIKEDVIVIAHDLSPSDTAQMVHSKVKGFATDIGGKTSHTAIMAKALGIPAVVGLKRITEIVKSGDTIIIDGGNGNVIINPSGDVIDSYRKKQRKYFLYTKELLKYRKYNAETVDGRCLDIMANIEMMEEIPSVYNYGANGIGLYRTEYLYVGRKELPSEDEHFEIYRCILEKLNPLPVVIRTLDLGGDKFVSPVQVSDEINPALGLRAIRFCLKRRDLFRTQLRALLRASIFGKLHIMFPLISSYDEVMEVKKELQIVKDELSSRGIPFDQDVKIGIMIEVPSAVMISEFLAREVDFFSIGTNDLIQYTLAIDRVNEQVSYLYDPLHPAILRMIKKVVDDGHDAGIKVGVCGEMASETICIPVLVALGVDQLSMNSISIPRCKRMIRSLNYSQLRTLVQRILSQRTSDEVEKILWDEMGSILERDWIYAS